MKSIEELDAAVWRVVALIAAGVLAVCMVRTIMGMGDFPWWHLATLAIAWRMGDCSRAFSAILARGRRFVRKGHRLLARLAVRVKSAVNDSLARTKGRLRGAPALFNEQ